MNVDRFNKFLERYWDDIFKDCELKPLDDEWIGMVTKNNEMIVGYNVNDYDDTQWYYDGNILLNHNKLLDMSNLAYNESMRNYLNRKFNLNIMGVM